MTIYVVMVEDRHTDTEVHLFSTPEKAIAYAQGVLDDNSESAKYVDSEERMSEEDLRAAGWLFFGLYSPEGDCVWVVPREVDGVQAP